MNNEENISGAENLLKKIKENKRGIHISRVPEKIKKEFIDLANEEFCGDYGMTLTFLMKGVIGHESQILMESYNDLNDRVNHLETKFSNTNTEDTKSVKLVNGKEINKK